MYKHDYSTCLFYKDVIKNFQIKKKKMFQQQQQLYSSANALKKANSRIANQTLFVKRLLN